MGNWDVIVTVALFGLGNGGLLLWKLSSLATRVQMNEGRLDRYGARVQALTYDVQKLKSEAGI